VPLKFAHRLQKNEKRDEENKTFTEYKDQKCIEMKNYFVSDLRKDSSSNPPVLYRYYGKGNEDISRIKK